MKNVLRVEVEPLSEQRWAAIERALLTQLEGETQRAADLPKRRNRTASLRPWRGAAMPWLAAALVVGALIFVVFAAVDSPEIASVDHPSRITTGESGSHLALSGLTLDVEPESAVVVSEETEQGRLLVLDRGSIVCGVAPRSGDAPLIVQAGNTQVRVIGTRFSVTRQDESAHVKVFKGVVEVTSAGRSLRLTAGEEWSNQPTRATTANQADSAQPASADEEPEQDDTTEAEQAAGTPETKSASKARARARSNAERETEASKPDESKASDSANASAQEIFEQATQLEHSDPARANRLYRSLESGSGSWAQNALYARGRLEATRGNARSARRLLESYLKRFPRGSNAQDARAVLQKLR
jgi:hypothetical protein